MPSDPTDPRRGILNYRYVELTDEGPAGGTNGARSALDTEATRWLVKHYRGNPDRVATELLANAIYRELDILVPEAGIGHWQTPNGVDWIACTYPMLEGERRKWSEPNALLAEGFVADALLANWDVIGLVQDNILWSIKGIPIRIDQGGTFEFRAQGQRKDYGPEPVELKTMLGPGGQARGRMAVTDEVLAHGSTLAIERLEPSRVDDLVSQAPFADREMADRLAANLKRRIACLDHV